MRRPSSATSVVFVLAFALLVGGLEAATLHIGAARAGRPMSWPRAVVGTFPSWVMTIAVAWPIRRLTRIARVDSPRWPVALLLHAIGASLFVALTLYGSAAIFVGLKLAHGPVATLAEDFVRESTASEVVIYFLLVTLFHALDLSHESAAQEEENARLAAGLTAARLDALRGQLRPHFFFNTLNAISSLALQRRPNDLVEMVGSLGDLVRSTLDEELPHEIPFERELGLLDLYLHIQRVRFEEWLRIDQEIGAEVRDLLVPSLLLQPLVENAVEHGAQDEAGRAFVVIRARREGGELVLEVENLRAPGASAGASPDGTGLRNTRSRLEHLYPGRHTMFAGPIGSRGWLTQIRMPAVPAPAGSAERE
jgi:hypothetical protein